MVKKALLISVILICGSCSVQDNELDYLTDTKQIKVLCQGSISAKANKPLYALLLDGKFYKIDAFLDDIPPSEIVRVSILKGERALAKYGAIASFGVIELEYKPAFKEQILSKNLEELTVTL